MPEPLDSADFDNLQDLLRHPGYALVVKRIREQLEKSRTALEGSWDLPVTSGLRGMVSAYRTVLDIPGILKDEISQSLKGTNGKEKSR